MKKRLVTIGLTVVLASSLIISGAYAYRAVFNKPAQDAELAESGNNSADNVDADKNAENPQVIGGQRDEHGCLGPAGYSWCEAKQKCLRVWEEACTPEDALRNYLRDNLSAISPEKEVLGGKFYVSKLEITGPGKARVEYEDGHNAFSAQFDYSITNDTVKVSNFRLMTETAPSAQNQDNATLKFQPMQCEQEPWQEWYAQGKVNFIKAPTDEELIKTYYGTEHGINVVSASKQNVDGATCLACSSCPKSYFFTAEVSADDASKMKELGWK